MSNTMLQPISQIFYSHIDRSKSSSCMHTFLFVKYSSFGAPKLAYFQVLILLVLIYFLKVLS